MLERHLKNSNGSLQRLNQAVALFEEVKSFADKPTFETAMLSMIHRNRADILTREGRTSEAVEAMKLANDLSPWINKGPGEPGRPKSQSRGFGRPGSPDR
jgi:hypothetical protein